ncbi:hypothetical protein ABOM_003184 [Aspergillus bombycis]|uniref:Uncharacterized protein n=1 Tax=Aspergillus bombycis TaxID=109264 RepID=A0A1F8ABR4_9EURO|nr:hypothetical protein ABOM_003184 [Aspergillus bombycis]OGM48885.1 hypothetical protein ABOM_003184 [Aspergillus bombycis]
MDGFILTAEIDLFISLSSSNPTYTPDYSVSQWTPANMKWSAFFPLSVSVLAVLPSTGAWEFTWKDASNTTHVESGDGPSECITVNHEKGMVFAIDGQGEKNINMLLYGTDDCSDKPLGQATERFSKPSSVDIHGFQVKAISTGSNSTTTAGNTTVTSTTRAQSSSTASSESSSVPTASATTTSDTAATTTSASETSTSTPNASWQLSVTGADMAKTVIGRKMPG